MTFNRLVLLPCFAALLACGGSPSTPTREPDVLGSWKNASFSWKWDWNYAYVGGIDHAGLVGSDARNGLLVISSQDDGTFGGRYAIDATAGEAGSSGAVLDGHLSPDGRVSFQLQAEEGWAPGLTPIWASAECQVSNDPGVYTGSLSAGSLSARRVQILSCPQGPIVMTASFQGVRQ